MSNDPQAPFPGAQPPEVGPDDAASAPSAPPYAAPQQAAPQQPPAPQYAPPPAPPTQASGAYPPPPPTGYAAAPQMGGVPSQAGQPADLLTRFLARFIDGVIVGVVLLVIFFIVTAVAVGAAVSGATTGIGFAWTLVLGIVYAALPLGYFSYLESRRGQTIGKMALKIRVEGPGGQTPTMEQALRRNVWLALPLLMIVPVVGFLGPLALLAAEIYIAVTINNNVATRQGWHDEFAGGTRVVKLG